MLLLGRLGLLGLLFSLLGLLLGLSLLLGLLGLLLGLSLLLGRLSLLLSLLGLLLSLRLVLLLRLDLSLRDGVVILAVAATHQRQTGCADSGAAGS